MKIKTIFNIILFLLGILFFVNYIFDERDINNEIYNNLAYTNGRVTDYQSSTSPTTGVAITSNCHVKYKYTVQD